jgi:hypothetical protein
MNVGACLVALCLSLWAGRRDWLDLQARGQHMERVNIVEWEDAGEGVESEED